MEFQKQDFIIKKIKNIRFINELLNKKKRNESKNGYGKKFTFKKKDLNICSEANILKIINNEFNGQSILTSNLSTSKVEYTDKNNLLMNDSLNIINME